MQISVFGRNRLAMRRLVQAFVQPLRVLAEALGVATLADGVVGRAATLVHWHGCRGGVAELAGADGFNHTVSFDG